MAYTKIIEPIVQKSIILLNNIDMYNSIYNDIENNIKSSIFNTLPISLIINQPEDINIMDNKHIKSIMKLTTEGFKIDYDTMIMILIMTTNNKFYIFNMK